MAMRPLLCAALLFGVSMAIGVSLGASTYYVSSTTGDDADTGLSPADAFATIDHVNGLSLLPGDEVLLLCGETWRTDPLLVSRSGTSGNAIRFSSHPADCFSKPVLSGSQPILGWSLDAGDVWVADLSAGANAGLFPNGLNQLFRGSSRLPFGRWPNIQGHADGGYAEVDAHPAPAQIVDAELPAGDCSGAVVHLKGIRWYIMNREVLSSVASTLTLGESVLCYDAGFGTDRCAGWGYWLSSHRATLDLEGEWFYDQAANRVYLYSASMPSDGEVEGSVVLIPDGSQHGGVILGRNLNEHITDVMIENLRIERWFDSGISTPINLEADENQRVVLRNNEIVDVDNTGIRLRAWVWDAAANGSGPNGWRGGRGHTLEGNVIDGANHFGIDSFGRLSTYQSNVISNIALIENLNRSGMGCGFDGTHGCTENGAGIRLNHDSGSPNHTAHDLTIRFNRLSKIGMNGIDSFGRTTTLQSNVIDEACYSKGDCGAIRTFGRTSLGSTPVHDIAIDSNVIRTPIGNTDGTTPAFDSLFGFGIYVDNFSRDVDVTDNTVVGSTASGLLFQESTGTATGNNVYDNAIEGDWGSQMRLMGSQASVSSQGNVFFALAPTRRAMHLQSTSQIPSSNSNDFFNAYEPLVIANDAVGGVAMTLANWQSSSGLDGASTTNWYTLGAAEGPRSTIFINDTGISSPMDLGGASYVDMDQQPIASLVLPAYSSQILVRRLAAIFLDGSESGDTTA